MFLNEILIKNLRVFENIRIKFNNDLNIIYGLNGQGKTSLLEAIHYLSLTKSFRVNKDSIVKKNESDYFDISGIFLDKNNLKTDLRIYFSEQEGKHAFLNSNKVKQFSEVVGLFPIILLSLDDLELTFGVPASRRKFLDVLLSQLFPGYLHNLRNYKKSVSQKNKLLNDENTFSNDEFNVWNKQLVAYGAEIIFQRVKFVEFANNHISKIYGAISKKDEIIKLKYNSIIPKQTESIRLEEIKKVFEQTLDSNKENEQKRRVCLTGPHKDDLEFLKSNYSFKTHGSQGENKSLLLALKVVESDYIYSIAKKKPLFLLDDIFGELDNNRIENLVDLIRTQGQTFITTTEISKFEKTNLGNNKFIHIHDHAIKQ